MAGVSRIIKVKNPKRGRARATKRKATRKGPAIKRYNVSQLKKELKKRGVKLGGPRKKSSTSTRRKATAHRRRSTIKRNPVLIELGMLNPKGEQAWQKENVVHVVRQPPVTLAATASECVGSMEQSVGPSAAGLVGLWQTPAAVE